MTEKQLKILESALKLFAENGYAATPTSKIAKDAGVSEGLIFRHFGNKEGLLQAILNAGVERALSYVAQIDPNGAPEDIIRAFIEMPFSVQESEHDFWRLIYTLKWQQGYSMEAMESSEGVLENAFKQLKYEQPKAEAVTLMTIVDGIATTKLLKEMSDKEFEEIKNCVLDKYQIKK